MDDAASIRFHRYRTAPNLLTLLRICLAPFLVAAILEQHYALSFGLFVAAGLTDALDGLLARLLKQRSLLGEYLDPVADKLLLSTLFLVLMHMTLIPVTVTVLVFGRDLGILVVAAILYAATGRREFAPSLLGKANTLVQVSAVAAVLLQAMLLQRMVTLHWVAKALRRLGALCNHGADGCLRAALRLGLRRGAWALRPANGHMAPSKARTGARFRRLPGWVLFRRSLRSPCRETLRSQRLRHNPGTRQTRCLRAGRRCVLSDACR
jgi:cardiolipin synthase